MKLLQTLALGFAASALWNCNGSTKPESASKEERVPAVVNSIAKYAALSSGYQVSSAGPIGPELPQETKGLPPHVFEAMRGAGICENFILLAEELFSDFNPNVNPDSVSPRLRKTVMCLIKEGKAGSAETMDPSFALMDKCFCDGAGSVFGGHFVFTKYSAPTTPARASYASPTLSPSLYTQPTLPGYSAPASPGGNGYSAPSL